MKPVWLPLAAALLMAASPSRAAQVVLDFETLAAGTDTITLSSYQADGFSLTSDIDPVMQADAFAAWETTSDNYTGSVALFNQYTGSQTTLAPLIAGQTFNLLAIDLAPALGDGAASAKVQFRGLKDDGTQLTADCAFGSALTLSTCKLPTFTDLASVTWTQGEVPHQFDNLVLTTAVPEPAEAAMLLAGLALLANRKRRARQAQCVFPHIGAGLAMARGGSVHGGLGSGIGEVGIPEPLPGYPHRWRRQARRKR